MIDYLTQYEDELTDRKTQIRYPFMVSDIMSTENAKLIDFLFGKFDESEPEEIKTSKAYQTLLPRLFSFLAKDSICMTSAGYFNKALVPIIRRKGFDVWNVNN
jgi:serine/threonine-protein phosphatase 6 regulatory subunit 3